MTAMTTLRESPAKYIEWHIPHFFELSTPVDNNLDSTYFSLSNAKWFLRISTNHEASLRITGETKICLMRKECTDEHHIAYRIGISNFNGSCYSYEDVDGTFSNTGNYGTGKSLLIDMRHLLRSRQNVAPCGTLTVFCALRIKNRRFESPVNVESASQTNFDGDVSSLCEDFKNIYNSSRCTDVTLLVKNKEFYAHKVVLIARSPVFSSMFEHDLSEKSSGKVEILDCDPSSFEQFLLFLYTCKLDNVSLKEAVDLYKTGDKYDVRKLKLECVHIMRRDLCVDFFCDIFHLAVMYNELVLLEDATSFFIDNAEAIMSTTKWQQFLEENPSLCNELLLKLVKSKNLRKDI